MLGSVTSEAFLEAQQRPLVPLPRQPVGTPWPTNEWPVGAVPEGVALDPLLDRVFDASGPMAVTQAVVVVHNGRLVAERYAGELAHFDRPGEPIGASTKLLSWSMAKSMLHAVVGMAVGDGLCDPSLPAAVPEWEEPSDPRHAITLQDLLEMRDGLDFNEDYVDDKVSDVIEMLFGSGSEDMAHYAADRPLAAPPGERFNYSSGTSNIVSGIMARTFGPGEPYQAVLSKRLFGPLGMDSAVAAFDDAGTFVASSTVHAIARDYARFGLLYLRDGVWEDRRLLPVGWVDHGRRIRSEDPTDGDLYGAHWWPIGDEYGTFRAAGYEGQSIVICPALDLIVVRLGKTPIERAEHLAAWRTDVVAAFAAAR